MRADELAAKLVQVLFFLLVLSQGDLVGHHNESHRVSLHDPSDAFSSGRIEVLVDALEERGFLRPRSQEIGDLLGGRFVAKREIVLHATAAVIEAEVRHGGRRTDVEFRFRASSTLLSGLRAAGHREDRWRREIAFSLHHTRRDRTWCDGSPSWRPHHGTRARGAANHPRWQRGGLADVVVVIVLGHRRAVARVVRLLAGPWVGLHGLEIGSTDPGGNNSRWNLDRRSRLRHRGRHDRRDAGHPRLGRARRRGAQHRPRPRGHHRRHGAGDHRRHASGERRHGPREEARTHATWQ
mmetsp:Transcript_40690/g.131028  ORF Transcript_40690/g.131028 Transcript_40690/m.131028 type:complete len:295 (+) Transcript_40690:1154-2038(+)